jgi:hypothetical protein
MKKETTTINFLPGEIGRQSGLKEPLNLDCSGFMGLTLQDRGRQRRIGLSVCLQRLPIAPAAAAAVKKGKKEEEEEEKEEEEENRADVRRLEGGREGH